MHRVLDDIANALRCFQRERGPQRVVASFDLHDQFQPPVTPSLWQRAGNRLGVTLPPLRYGAVFPWTFPVGWTTVWDLADFVATNHCWAAPPSERSTAEWREAQIFVGVRSTLVECLGIDEEEIVRSSRLGKDLGAE